MFIKFEKVTSFILLLLVVFTWQACSDSKEKGDSKADTPEKKKLEAYVDSISALQTKMSKLIESGKASTDEVAQLRENLKNLQAQLGGSMEALKASQGKNAELTAYISKMEERTKNQAQQIAVLMEQVSKLETENKEQKKTIEEKDQVITDTKNQKEFTVALSSLQDKYNTAFEKAKNSKGKDECNTFKDAYRYAKQIGELCEGKEAMVSEAGKTYTTVMGLKEQVLARAKSDMSKSQYAKCFSGYK